jgi:hypothetical protein
MKTTQSLDVWTLGCLFLDFLSWLVEGPKSIEKFGNLRRSVSVAGNSAISFYDTREDCGGTLVSVSESVFKVRRTPLAPLRLLLPN